MHGSIINLILDEETLPSWNPYHMGGQLLPTPPGFHFFVSILILFSGIPLLFAELLTAAFFSSVIVFPAYLVSKRIWGNSSAGVLAAFFAAVSALSLEMISWGGYTNVVSLALIVLIMYLFLRDMDHPSIFNLLMGALLFGAAIITHTFSLFVMVPVLILYFIFLLIGKIWKLADTDFLKKMRFFIVSGALGVLAVSPWLLRVFSFYIGASSEGSFLGGVPYNRNLILANRTVDSMILGLFIALIPAFFLFKAYRKRYADSKSLLLIAWFVVPLVMTQAFIFGVFVDYSRFMYFIDFPGIIIISAGLLYLFSYTSTRLKNFSRINGNRAKKLVPVSVFTAIIITFIVISPWSIIPNDAQQRADFYTTIQQPEATTIDWIRNKTPESSVLVADHLYGWWLSGISKRATLSAAGLEFLLYAQEMEVARAAQLLLDTDYQIDNGLIQIRDDGSYISRHNPVFSVETWSGEAFPLFYFQDNETLFEYKQGTDYRNVNLSNMEVTETSITKDENLAVLTVTREDSLFTVKKTLQVQRGVRFAELSYEITAKTVITKISAVNFTIHTTADELSKGENTTSASIIEAYNSHRKVAGQVIGRRPYYMHEPQTSTNCVDIMYKKLRPVSNIKITFLVGGFDAGDLSYPDEVSKAYNEYADSPLDVVTDDPITVWDYTEMIKQFDVTHVVCRDQKVYAKFSEDPNFQLVFNSGKVAVFQVTK